MCSALIRLHAFNQRSRRYIPKEVPAMITNGLDISVRRWPHGSQDPNLVVLPHHLIVHNKPSSTDLTGRRLLCKRLGYLLRTSPSANYCNGHLQVFGNILPFSVVIWCAHWIIFGYSIRGERPCSGGPALSTKCVSPASRHVNLVRIRFIHEPAQGC